MRKKYYSIYTHHKWIGSIIILLLIQLTIYSSNHLVKKVKEKEELNIRTYISALGFLLNQTWRVEKVHKFLLDIIKSNKSIPVVVVDKENKNEVIFSQNIEAYKIGSKNLLKTLESMQSLYVPNDLKIKGRLVWLYHGNSYFLYQWKFYPIILIFTLVLFSLYWYRYLYFLKTSEKNQLWVGMAKETAHQIGTPLSAMMGWVELLKSEEKNWDKIIPLASAEMLKDIERLSQIADRFSKIGSQPILTYSNIVEVTKKTIDYLRSRISKNIHLDFYSNKEKIITPLNDVLYSWAIENIIKNAVDSILSPKGLIIIHVIEERNKIFIDLMDSGKGVPLSKFEKIFEVGYSTKNRGWGYGLALTRRIIEEYHPGKVYVLSSQKNKGTIIRISFLKEKEESFDVY